jgi:hypothetical protein
MTKQDFGMFAKNYKPLRFKFAGIAMTEYIPRQTTFDMPQLLQVRLKAILGLNFTYFDFRSSLTPVGKKRADMAFLTHVIQKCDTDAQNAPWVRYYLTRLRYFAELRHINSHIGTKQANSYMLRWGYLLDHDPSFDELVHGTSPEVASYALDMLI